MSAELERTPRTRARWPVALAALVALQALALAGYLVVERSRAEPPPAPPALTPVAVALPPLVLERPGASLALPDDEVTLLHVWATWCKPCREELPDLLALDGQLPARLLTVSTDETWDVVAHFFEGEVPPSVWRVAVGGERLPVDALPATLVVRDGAVVGRLDGATEWTREVALALLEQADVPAGEMR